MFSMLDYIGSLPFWPDIELKYNSISNLISKLDLKTQYTPLCQKGQRDMHLGNLYMFFPRSRLQVKDAIFFGR